MNQFAQTDNWMLVMFAIAAAFLAAYAIFASLSRAQPPEDTHHTRWKLVFVSFAGTALWLPQFVILVSTHASIEIFYHWPTLVFSWLVAMVPASLLLWMANKKELTAHQIILIGSGMGFGLFVMQMIGLESIRLHAMLSYNLTVFALGLAVGVLTSIAAIWLSCRCLNQPSSRFRLIHWGYTFFITISLLFTHLVVGSSGNFTLLAGSPPSSYRFAFPIGSSLAIGLSVSIIFAVILWLVISYYLRELAQQNRLVHVWKDEVHQGRKELDAQVEQMERLYQLSKVTLSTLDFDTLIDSAIKNLVEHFGYSDTYFYIFNQNRNSLEFYSHYTNRESGTEESFLINERLIFEAVYENRSLILESADSTQIGIPVRNEEQVLAVLAINQQHLDSTSPVTVKDVHLLEHVAELVGFAIQHANMFHEVMGQKEEACSANEIKSEFLTKMTQELRDPLHGILGITQSLLNFDVDLEQQNLIEKIRSQGDSLLKIVNDILDFSKIEANQIDLRATSLNLRECIEESFQSIVLKSAHQHINTAYSIDKNVPIQIFQDEIRLKQVLQNMLSNASKFTKKGEIHLSVTAAQMEINRYKIEFALRDTGTGISAEGLKRLFKSYNHVDGSINPIFGGRGLGLTISKRLCEMMGGTMWVESELGSGSTFYFSVMAEHDAQFDPETFSLDNHQIDTIAWLDIRNQTNRNLIIDHLERWQIRYKFCSGIPADWTTKQADLLVSDQFSNSEIDELTTFSRKYGKAKIVVLTQPNQSEIINLQLPNCRFLTVPLLPHQLSDKIKELLVKSSQKVVAINRDLSHTHPLRILLAEDNPINQKVALKVLKRLGFEADVVANGIEVLQTLSKAKYDVILMDVQMPGMSGVEAVREIHNRLGGSPSGRPWIIGTTTNALISEPEEYVEAGMDDYLGKPFRIQELIAALKKVPISEPVAQ